MRAQVTSMQGMAEKYRATQEENRRLYNEVQDLKGNIRVFCRVRPAGATGDASAGESPPSDSPARCVRMTVLAALQGLWRWLGPPGLPMRAP